LVERVSHRILIISPVRNEARHIERVVRAVAAQELKPARWIIVDDHSDDDTFAILRQLESDIDWLTVMQTPIAEPTSVRDRLARAAAPRAFNVGLKAVDPAAYTHIMKLDGDIELDPGYLRRLMERFDADPTLGIAAGVLVEPQKDGSLRPLRIARNHVHGALKCYTQACFQRIGGVQERLGWDTVDETYARMHGFTTYSFTDLVSVHHRPAGSADGALRGHARHGECAYIAHQTPSWVALRAVKISTRAPRGISGAAFFYGFVRAAARRVERIPDPAYRRFTHRELRRRMVGAVLPRGEARR